MSRESDKIFLKSYKRRLKQKLEDVIEDAENACSFIQKKTSMLKERTAVLLEQKDEAFMAEYQQLQKDIEWLSDKLFVSLKLLSSSSDEVHVKNTDEEEDHVPEPVSESPLPKNLPTEPEIPSTVLEPPFNVPKTKPTILHQCNVSAPQLVTLCRNLSQENCNVPSSGSDSGICLDSHSFEKQEFSGRTKTSVSNFKSCSAGQAIASPDLSKFSSFSLSEHYPSSESVIDVEKDQSPDLQLNLPVTDAEKIPFPALQADREKISSPNLQSNIGVTDVEPFPSLNLQSNMCVNNVEETPSTYVQSNIYGTNVKKMPFPNPQASTFVYDGNKFPHPNLQSNKTVTDVERIPYHNLQSNMPFTNVKKSPSQNLQSNVEKIPFPNPQASTFVYDDNRFSHPNLQSNIFVADVERIPYPNLQPNMPFTNVEKIPSQNLQSSVEKIPSQNLQSSVEKIPSQNLQSNVEQIPSQNLQSIVEQIPSQNLQSNVAKIPSQNLQSNVEQIPSQNLQSNVAVTNGEKIPSQNLQSNVEKIPSKNLQSNVEKIPLPNLQASTFVSNEMRVPSPNLQLNKANVEKTLFSSGDLCERIPLQNVTFGKTGSCYLTKFKSPSDFWIRIENPVMDLIAEELLSCTYTAVESSSELKYCLAPYQESFCRTEIISVTKKGNVQLFELFFIDFGATEVMPASNVKKMPSTLYHYPAQGIHCFLYGVAPIDGNWIGDEEVESEFFDLQVKVLFQHGMQFAVQLTSNSSEPEETFDVADRLCILGLASQCQEHEALATCYASETVETSDKFIVSNSTSPSEISKVEDEPNRQKNNPVQISDYILDRYVQPVVKPKFRNSQTKCESIPNLHSTGAKPKYSTSSSRASLHNQDKDFIQVSSSNSLGGSGLHDPAVLGIGHSLFEEFNVNLVVPAPQPLLLQDDLIIVIPSVIYSPSYFYAHCSMKNPLELDDLREEMTIFYSSLTDESIDLSIDVKDLKKDMYLACSFDDGCWYRILVNAVFENGDTKEGPKAVVLYVDYGNESIVPVKNLRPLTTKFASFPAMAILCSLAHVGPKGWDDSRQDEIMHWPHDAIDFFGCLMDKEKTLTAQLSKFTNLKHNRVLHEVFLWDSDENGDSLINDLLVQKDLANYFHLEAVPVRLTSYSLESSTTELEQLCDFDPMADDYVSVQNSYAVNPHDPEIATVGYKARDEQYVCKYFGSNRPCYRGDDCPYLHIMSGYECETLDQDPVDLYENLITLPKVESYCFLRVSYIMDPGHFYVVFPFGTEPVSSVVRNPVYKSGHKAEYEFLAAALNEHYSTAPFSENTTIALASGTVVAAKDDDNDHWFRAQVIEVVDVGLPVMLFMVDVGKTKWVRRRDIRELLPQFRHCPFQAVEAFLANVKPVNSDGSTKWSIEAMVYFEEMVCEKLLLGFITRKINESLVITLKTTSEEDREVINDQMVLHELAQFSSLMPIQGSTEPTGLNSNTAIEPG